MKKGFFSVFLALYALSVGAQEITNVSFTQEGEISKLVIEADKALLAERFHVTEDKQIILDIKNAKVSGKLLRGIDTSEFPGSTVYVSGYRKPGTTNDVRFAIQLRDNVRSVLETKGNNIVLNIENRFGVFTKNQVRSTEVQAKSQENFEDAVGINVPKSTSLEDILENLTLAGPKKYVGRRISINVRDIPVTEVLNMIADTSGFNIIIDKEVGSLPSITLSLTNVPWDQALDTIMKLSKLVAEKNANILIIKTAKQAAEEQKLVAEQVKQRETLEPLVTRVFLINYSTLTEIKNVITDYITKDRGKIQTDERTNSLIVRDTVEAIDRIKKIIETLDTQTPQILIEAKIVEASENYSKRVGLTNGLTFGYDPVVNTEGVLPTGPGFNFSTTGSNNPTPGVMGVSIGIYKRLRNLNFNLEMLEQESKVRVVSSPRVVTQNKKPATLTANDTTAFSTNTVVNGTVTQGFSNATASTSLNVTPQVTNDGAINLTVVVTKSSFGVTPQPGAPPNTVSRTVNTNVLVDNGSTVVVGGLYTDSQSEIESGIPYLKDLPLVGWLFRNPFNTTQGRTELVIFITPRILNQEEAGFSDRRATNVKSDSESI